MDKDFLIGLTNNLYRITLLFPKKEPLRYKIRETAIEILAEPSEKNLEILDSFFEVVKCQNWVRIIDLLAIQKEYDNLKGEFKKGNSAAPEQVENKEVLSVEARPQQGREGQLLERQEKILDFLRENGRAQVWQIRQILPEVTKRTLRRDFEQMLKQGIVERVGERNDTFYQICNKMS
ncbi:MAG: DeoR family transcriptional regulator [bacterium]